MSITLQRMKFGATLTWTSSLLLTPSQVPPLSSQTNTQSSSKNSKKTQTQPGS